MLKNKNEKKYVRIFLIIVLLLLCSFFLPIINAANVSSLNADVKIPKEYRQVVPGKELVASIKLMNLGSEGRVDVSIDYRLHDNNKDILTKTETVAVETQANFVRTFDIPQDSPIGTYNLDVTVTYSDGKKAAGSDTFEVVNEKKVIPMTTLIIGILIFIVIILIGSFIFFRGEKMLEKIKIKSKIDSLIKKKLRSN